ncbi:protein LIFEGUARD 2-like [Phragmites australis]|uniref:protein LIFEGUARD 2-like n=1 Tax=Phragmites australis TaxID=29695 RepID=UPI002D768B3B|nr:protein LIFEGUARD 2-like [Phragmites australis]
MSKPQAADLEAAAGVTAAAAENAKAGEAPSAEAKPKKMVAEEEDPRLRWAFVRKVYAILALQFALTAAIAAAACFVRAVPRFFVYGPPAAVWPVYIVILIAPLIVMWPMFKYREKHPVNLYLLGLFTLCCSLSLAVAASTTAGTVVLQAAIQTAAVVIGLTLFTFWAVKKGYEFTFMFPFLFACLLTLLVYITIQIFFPLGMVGMTIYGCIATLVFSCFIIYDTNMLLKRHTYNEYVVAAISLYLDVINLFMAQLSFSVR